MEYPRPYGGYVLLERLGVGGMSEVDLARKAVEDAGYLRFVVIKRIKADHTDDDAFVRMFKDEARITSELHHANIAHVYDFGRCGDEYYMALEYVAGLDVRRIINTLRKRGQRVPVRTALKITCDVLAGLDYAHNRVDRFGNRMEIVHRDVNPRNIMVSAQGEVKLIDFGVARATNRLERTRTDHVKGKFAYMAPEQLKGREMDHRADLFAVGLTLHELLTGYSPFHGMSQVQVVHRLLSGKISEPPDLPEAGNSERLLAAYHTALQLDPDDRFQSAAHFRADLLAAAEEMGGLPSNRGLAEFVSRVDPELGNRLRTRMDTWSGPIETLAPQVRAIDAEIQTPIAEPVTMSGVTVTVSRGQLVAGGVAAMLVALAAVLLIGTVGLLGLLTFRSGSEGLAVPESPAPEVVAAAPVVPAPAPEPESAPAPEPIGTADAVPAPAPEATVAPKPAPRPAPIVVPVVKPAPEPTIVRISVPAPVGTADAEPAPRPVPTVAPDPVPAPAPAPISAPAPAPVVAPAPAPAPAAVTGILQITSSPAGRSIRVGGADTGLVTPAELRWPVGTVEVEVDGVGRRSVTVRKDAVSLVVVR